MSDPLIEDKVAQGPLGRLMRWLFSGGSGSGLVAVLALTGFGVVLFMPRIFNDGDTYWHLAAGEWILSHSAVPTTDPFSHTFAGAPWQAHEWLAEAIMALAFRAAGWNGLLILFALAFGATAAVLGTYLRRWLAPGPLMVTLGFALACGAPSLLARPHQLALPVLAAWAVGLMSARDKGRAPSAWLLLLMAAWANLHGSFVLGLALIGPFALEAVIEKRDRAWPAALSWGGFALAALAAAVITPHGLDGLIFPFEVSFMQALPMIDEWRSADFSKMSVFEVVLLEALFFCLWGGVKIPAVRLVLLLGLLHLALQHVRHQAVFGVLGALILAQPFARGADRAPPPAAEAAEGRGRLLPVLIATALAIVVTAGVRLALPTAQRDGVNAPASALAKVPPDLARRPMLNEYSFGGLLIFKGLRPFIDGRADMYGDRFVRDYDALMRAKPAALSAALDRRGIAWTILAPENQAVASLDSLPNWRRLSADKYAVVHVRIASASATGDSSAAVAGSAR